MDRKKRIFSLGQKNNILIIYKDRVLNTVFTCATNYARNLDEL